MAASRTTEPAREEAPASDADAAPESSDEASAQPTAGGGGWKAWLPLGLALVVMPLCAYAMTTFLLVPRMQKALRATGVAPAAAEAEPAPEKTAAEAKEGGEGG